MNPQSEETSKKLQKIARFRSFSSYPPPSPSDSTKPTIKQNAPALKPPPAQDKNNIIPMRTVKVKCPICSAQKEIDIPESVINHSKQLATVSINPHSVCNHSFQIFIDKNFKVRGYQKPEYEVNGTGQTKKEDAKFERMQKVFAGIQHLKDYDKAKEKKNIPKNRADEHTSTLEQRIQQKKMTLEDIYEIFWQDIDDENREFREFIVKDPRRETRS